jgi:hypothetical protein
MSAQKGKPLNWVWEYFHREKEEKAIVGYCNFCNLKMGNHADRLAKHLLNYVCFYVYYNI